MPEFTIQGKTASEDERRIADWLTQTGYGYEYEVDVPVPSSMQGAKKYVDFVITINGRTQPFEVDGEIGHNQASEKGADAMREAMLNQTFKSWGWLPMKRIAWTQYETKASLDYNMRIILDL